MRGNTLAMRLLLVSTLTYTGSAVDGTLLGGPGENVAKLGTILPLTYQSLCSKLNWKLRFKFQVEYKLTNNLRPPMRVQEANSHP